MSKYDKRMGGEMNQRERYLKEKKEKKSCKSCRYSYRDELYKIGKYVFRCSKNNNRTIYINKICDEWEVK